MRVKLNVKHLIFLIAGVAIVSLKTYPIIIIKEAKRESWIAVIIGCVIIFAFLWYILAAFKEIEEFKIDKVFKMGFGKFFGSIGIFFYVLCMLLTVFETTSVEGNVLHADFLINTPVWLFIGISVLSGLFVVKKGGAAIITTSIIALVMISMSGVLLGVLTQRYKKFEYLFPVFQNGVNMSFVWSIIKIVGALSCVSIIFPYFDGIEDKTKIKRYTLGSLLFVIQMQIVSMIGVLSTFTLKRAENIMYPKLNQTQLVSYFGFMEAGELFVMLQVVAGWFMKFCITFYALLLILYKLGVKSKLVCVILGALTFGVSYYCSKNMMVLMYLLDKLLITQFVCFFALPLLATTCALIKYKLIEKKKESEIGIGSATNI